MNKIIKKIIKLVDKLLERTIYPFYYPNLFYRNNINKTDWNGKRACLTISFDCDYEKDVASLPALLDILAQYSFKASFASIGKLIEQYPKEHARIIEEGHEIINHTYSHPDNEELNPDQKFNELTREQKKAEINKCQEICVNLLKYSPIGFRTPHFGNLHTDDVYEVLKESGYRYSSSTSAIKTPNFGLPFAKKRIIEFPLSNCPKHPFAVFDSWHSFKRGNKKHAENGEFYKLSKELIDIGISTNSYINLYFDPMDIVDSKDFKLMLDYVEKRRKEIWIATYKEILERKIDRGSLSSCEKKNKKIRKFIDAENGEIKQIIKNIYRKLRPLIPKKFCWYLAQKIEKRAWDRWLKDNLTTMDKRWLDMVLKYFNLDERKNFGNKVLVDIGSGPIGILTRVEAKEKIAVDPLLVDSIDPSIKRIKAPGEKIPLNDESVNYVFLYNVLQHVMSPEKVLKEGVRILKPGGTFCILEQLNVPVDPTHPHSLKLEMFNSWILENKFRIIKKTVEKDHYLNFDSFAPGSGYAIICLILQKI